MPKVNEGNFYKTINRAIAEGRHVAQLKEIIKDFEEYKRIFAENFSDQSPKQAVYKFRAIYLLKKATWREIEILGEQTFCDLAEMIIGSMGWLNDHMHGFELTAPKPDPRRMGLCLTIFAPGWEDDSYPTFKSDEVKISDLDYAKQPKLRFMFDYGDGHEFKIEFKGTRVLDKHEKSPYFPRLTDQRGVTPEQYPGWDELEEEESLKK